MWKTIKFVARPRTPAGNPQMSRATLGESVHMSSEHMDSRNIHISIKALLDRPYVFKKYLNTKNSKLAFTA